ncbi:hypothetical protein T23_05810 [Turicibacter faecis]|uniref:MAE-28990/MAE-18760-like HEPN domain-containing protein n=2 Tax=Turicibacter faecis TaxID=2963365 RepID=A0ABN6Z9G7_9FIRM|nr:hypothetical protein T23_05810 [Turicibacter sp. TC023]
MQETIDMFNDRVEEIKLYYSALEKLYDFKEIEEENQDFLKDDFLKILKSNALLMVYNLVESTIMGGILEIYENLHQKGMTYKMVRKEIQEIWFSYKFNQVYAKNAHFNSYKGKAMEIINFILEETPLELDRKATDISGNLDADKIRQICQEHGIVYNLDKDSRGGIILKDVKDKRNNLAHGTISFVECGRDYSMDDLDKIKRETISFLNSILEGMQNYYDNELYLSSR